MQIKENLKIVRETVKGASDVANITTTVQDDKMIKGQLDTISWSIFIERNKWSMLMRISDLVMQLAIFGLKTLLV